MTVWREVEACNWVTASAVQAATIMLTAGRNEFGLDLEHQWLTVGDGHVAVVAGWESWPVVV